MLPAVSRNWWIAAVRGMFAMVVGVLAFVWPAATLEVLVLLFGAYALLDGITTLLLALRAIGSQQRAWPSIIGGLIGILTGVATFALPGLVALSLVYVVAAWAVITGALQIVTAICLRDVISGEWRLAAGGALSILFGLLLMTGPLAGALTLVFLFGLYAIAAGISQVAFGLHVRRLSQRLRQPHAAASIAQ
jgi:uncharacterized membrane protein HdeD (DUF308 family)